MPPTAKLLIIGASVRAAAQSATQAGYEVVAADLFADRDLRACAGCFRVRDYPAQFEIIRQRFPDLPLIYTGALENYPSLIRRLETTGVTLGNGSQTLRQVCDPLVLAKALQRHDIPFPQTLREPPYPAARKRDWLLKPVNSAGGNHVAEWDPAEPPPTEGYVWQEKLVGTPCSAAFVVAKRDRCVRFLGATRMLVGRSWGADGEFTYCGSTTWNSSQHQQDDWTAIGQSLCNEFALIGVFGVDAISTEYGLVPIEVNPRYTASMEVIEPSLQRRVLDYHVRACRDEQLGDSPRENDQPSAKLIVYANRSLTAPDVLPNLADKNIRLADLPTAGQRIEAGRPVLTLLGTQADDLRSFAYRIRNAMQ